MTPMTTQTEQNLPHATAPEPRLRSNCLQNRWENIAIALFICLPLLSLTVNALSWLRFGLDMPFWDDWRGYITRNIGSFKFNHLFQASCDTMSPVGLMLDSLAQRYLDGNSIAYQFISMVSVLGLLLFFQWRLLTRAIKNRLVAASAFSLTLFMLQPHTYWGEPNLAYHQAIPLVCIMATLFVALDQSWRDFRNIPLLLLLGTIAGLSYISGAFSVLAIGIVLLFLGRFLLPPARKQLLKGGIVLSVTGVITAIPQLWVITVVQKGTHRSDAPMALPIEKDFWLFMLGKVGRALMLPTDSPNVSLIIATIVAMAILVLIGCFIKDLANKKEQTLDHAGLTIIFMALSAVIFVYLLLIAAGRTNFRPPELCNSFMDTAAGIFIFAFARFHYFWVTLLWPWVFAASINVLGESKTSLVRNSARYLPIAIPVIVLPLAINAGALNHAPFYRDLMRHRSKAIPCLTSEVQKGSGINCRQLYVVDLAAAFVYAKSIDSSFTRTIPFRDIPFGTVDPAPLFKLLGNPTNDVDFKNIFIGEQTSEGYGLLAEKDPAILFKTGQPTDMKRCLALKVSARMTVMEADMAQLFYKTPSQTNFAPSASQNQPLPIANELIGVTFELLSPSGFSDDLMFVPVTKQQQFHLRDIEVRCQLEGP